MSNITREEFIEQCWENDSIYTHFEEWLLENSIGYTYEFAMPTQHMDWFVDFLEEQGYIK